MTSFTARILFSSVCSLFVLPVQLHAIAESNPAATVTPESSPTPIVTISVPEPTVPPQTPRPLATPSVVPVVPTDRAFFLAGGTWLCESFTGFARSETFEQDGDAALVSTTPVSTPKGAVAVDERLSFDSRAGRWTMSINHGSIIATSPAWTHAKWIFDGVRGTKGGPRPVRSVFTNLGDRAFRYDFQVRLGDRWLTVTGETCVRGSR